jgi:hypothetical protein
MSKRVICTNENNVQVEFNYDEDNAFFLQSLEGVYSVSNNVTTSENTMTDGSTYQGSVTKQRNIVIGASMDSNYQENRDLLYKCFKPKATGTFSYIEKEETRKIDYKVESIDIGETGVIRDITISLICPDPFFVDLEDIIVTMAGWKKTFTWPHQFKAAREPFGVRIAEIIKTVENDSAAENIGIEILMEASGAVTNPALYHVEEEEYIKVGTTANPLSLAAGEAVRITTSTNNKNVYLILNGKETEINEYLDEESEFIQLVHGQNTLKYDADSGLNYLNVTISYRFRYLGV